MSAASPESVAQAEQTRPYVAMVAGEASGDLLAGLLLDGLRQRWPLLTSVGIGGPQMQRHGFDAWWPHHQRAVHGFGWGGVRRRRGDGRSR